MAQNDDLVGFLMKTVFELFAWIFKIILKIIWMIISGIFKGIVSLFKKDSSSETTDTE